MKKQQVPKYYTVKEIKTGRIFQAEYDSESAAYYEKGTGREYNLTEVVHLFPNDMDRIDKIKKAIKKVTSSKDNARDFLCSADIMTEEGDLHPRYK